MRIFACLILLTIAWSLCSFLPPAGYSIGGLVMDFKLKNVDGRQVSLGDYKTAKGFIIVFTCNHCPFAKRYQDRLNQFNKKYAPLGIPVLAISATDPVAVPEDDFKSMAERAKQQHYTFPYLFDSTQVVAKAFNAAKTPHAFVISKAGGQWILRYSGAIDDNVAEPELVKNHYLEDAVKAILEGKSVATPTTKTIGCPIKWRVAAN